MEPTTRATLVERATGAEATDDLFVRKALIPVTVDTVGERTVRFVISTDAVDRDNDTIDPKGWDLKAYLKNPVVLWAHDYKSLPVGRATTVVMRDGQLISECEFAKHEFAETVFQMVKGGFLKATSVGFRPQKYAVNEQRQGLDFSQQELMEYSIVPVPSNPEALIDLRAAKAAGIDVGPLVVWAKAVMKAVTPVEPETTPEPEPVAEKAPDPVPEAVIDPAIEPVVEPVIEIKGPDAMPDTCPPDEKGNCPGGYEMRGDSCHRVEKKDDDKAVAPVVCRICEQELATKMPRLRDDLGVVCAPCFTHASAAPQPQTVAPVIVEATTVKESFVLDLDDGPREEVAVELDNDDDGSVIDLSPDDLRAALRSAVTSAVSTIVRDETRAAFNRARGRVD